MGCLVNDYVTAFLAGSTQLKRRRVVDREIHQTAGAEWSAVLLPTLSSSSNDGEVKIKLQNKQATPTVASRHMKASNITGFLFPN